MISISLLMSTLCFSMAIESNYHSSANPENLFSAPNSEIPKGKEHLVNTHMFQQFSDEIHHCFPSCVATVVGDRNGFLIHADSKIHMDENLLALSAICKTRKILDLSKYHKIMKPLSKNVHLLVLLNKSRQNYLKYGQFEQLVQQKNPV